MSNPTLVQGTQIRLRASFTNQAGVAADPSTVTCKIQRTWPLPAAAVSVLVYLTSPELVKEAVGVYYVDLLLSAAGTWRWRFEGTGTVYAAEQDAVNVEAANPL